MGALAETFTEAGASLFTDLSAAASAFVLLVFFFAGVVSRAMLILPV
jgi:hypothetical protein